MSSVDFRNLRRIPSLTTRINNMIAEYQRFASSQITIENTDFKTIHRSTQSLLKYTELTTQTKVKPKTTQFYTPMEPDLNHVVLMLNLDQLGRYAPDSSGFGHRGKIAGAGYAPQVIMDDGIDVGWGTNSEYLYFDGRYTFVYVEDNPRLRAERVVNSMTFTFRLYMMADSWTLCDPNDESKPRYLFAKSDSSTQQSGYACAFTSDGRLKFTWVKFGNRYTVQTDASALSSANPGYDQAGYSPSGFDTEDIAILQEQGLTRSAIGVFNIVIVAEVTEGFDDGFDEGFQTGPSTGLKIIVDSAFRTGSSTPVINTYTEQTQNHLDLFVGNETDIPDDIDDPIALDANRPLSDENLRLRIGAAYPFSGDKQTWFKFIGGIQHLRIYREILLTDIDIQFLFVNKLTISQIPFGQVAYSGYAIVLPTAVGCCGFDQTGFDSTGFDTGL